MENAGLKIQDQISGVENAGVENARAENVRPENGGSTAVS